MIFYLHSFLLRIFRTIFSALYSQQTTKRGPRLCKNGGREGGKKDLWFWLHTLETINQFGYLELRLGPADGVDVRATAQDEILAGAKKKKKKSERLHTVQTDRQTGRRTITQSKQIKTHSDCQHGCIFTQVAVCIREIEPLPPTIIPPLVFCRSRLWHNAIAFIYFIHFGS